MKIECNICKKEINRKPSEINPHNNFCSKICHKKYLKEISNSSDIRLNKIIKSMWGNVNIRCGKYSHLQTKSKCKSYNDISIEFTRDEFKAFCIENKSTILSLNRPSLDRINSKLNYSLNNIQIIELSDNIKKKKVGNTYITNSFGIKRGVKKVKNGYIATITYNEKEIYLGKFNDENDAYEAFRNKYFELRGVYPW